MEGVFKMSNVGVAILLTALAGLSTSIGGLIAIFSKNTNNKFLAFSLGVSAGVMLYVSFMELLTKSISTLSVDFGVKFGTSFAVAGFFCGMFMAALIDKFIPEGDVLSVANQKAGNSKLMRTGLVTALALGIHNFPEGMATFVSALQSPVLAIPIVAAIAIHNIPEGVAVAVPIYFATNNKKRALLYTFLSGIAEPVGAVMGYLILMPYISDRVNAYVFAVVAGLMVFISVDELLPSAREYSQSHLSVYGLVCGMIIMAISLIGFM